MICKRCGVDKKPEDMAEKPYPLCQACLIQARYFSRVKHTNGISMSKARQQVLAYYGAVCVCCGEQDKRFLELDHVFNDGKVHRQEIGKNVYIWLIKNNFPTPERFQILCSNCNQGKRKHGGICPHKLTNRE